MDCVCLRLVCPAEYFIILVWEPLSSIHLIRPFLSALKKHGQTTKHRALGFQKDGWSCGSEPRPHKLGGRSPGFFFGCSPRPNGSRFVDCVLSMVFVDRAMRVMEALGDDWRA